MKSFTIKTPKGERTIGVGHPAFIIAEMSANHCQDFNKAVEIVKAAAEAGADAIKLQTYTPDTMTIDSNKPCFLVKGGENPNSWQDKTLYNLYQKAYTPWEWHAHLQKLAESLGLVFFSTPFDPSAVDFLEKLEVPLYKIASYEVTYLSLLKEIAKTRKPVIMSTGFASQKEIEQAISTLRENGTEDLCILHCVTAYSKNPQDEEINLKTMLNIAEKYDVICGFSDNNAGIEIPLQAVMMGASVIEKHIVVAGDKEACDADFSLNPSDFKVFVEAVRRAERRIGKVNYGTQGVAEENNIRYRRSLFVVRDINIGEPFTSENIKTIRPAAGLAPQYYDEIIGKNASKNIERGTPLQWEMIDCEIKSEIKRTTSTFNIDSTALIDPALLERLLQLHQKNNADIIIERAVKIAPNVIFSDNLKSLHLEQYVSIGECTLFAFESIKIGAYSVVGNKMYFGKTQMETFVPGVEKSRMNSFKELIIGIGAQMYGDCEIYALRAIFGNFIKMGKRVQIDGYQEFQAGHNVWVGRDSTLNATGGLEIGNNTGIGEKCLIWSHGYWSDLLEGSNIFNIKKVTIGDECWIAAGVTISPGVTIANRVMMLPESNVTKSIKEENIIVGLNPAKKVQTEKSGELRDLVHFISKSKAERYDYLKDVLANFSKRFKKSEQKQDQSYVVWDLIQENYLGKIVLLLDNNINLKDIISPSDENKDVLIFSPQDMVDHQFTNFNYLTRTHSPLIKLNGYYNLLALEFIRGSNTYIAKFIPR